MFFLDLVVQQEISKEGIIWSILSVPAVSYRDSGKYVCRATNFVGSADAIIHLSFLTHGKSTKRPPREVKERRTLDSAERLSRETHRQVRAAATSAAVPIIEPLNGPKASSSIRIESYSTSDGVSKAKATAPPAAAAGSTRARRSFRETS